MNPKTWHHSMPPLLSPTPCDKTTYCHIRRRCPFLFLAIVFMTTVALSAEPKPQMILPKIGEPVALPQIKEICEFHGLHALWLKIERDPPLLPFKSDGCTGWFDEWKGVSLYLPGFLHDLKYWAGYPGEDVERLAADAELMMDVARLLGSTEMAETMFHGVRMGGGEKLNAPFSWGFGRKPIHSKTDEPAAKPVNS
jgi:hypothetical protein